MSSLGSRLDMVCDPYFFPKDQESLPVSPPVFFCRGSGGEHILLALIVSPF